MPGFCGAGVRALWMLGNTLPTELYPQVQSDSGMGSCEAVLLPTAKVSTCYVEFQACQFRDSNTEALDTGHLA